MSAETIVLCRLRQRMDVVIKPTEKGSAVVFLGKDYINEAERQLNNHSHYVRLNTDPTPLPASEIKSFITSMFVNRQIDKYTRDFLISQHPRVARFNLLPKVHKPCNPGRLIVSSTVSLNGEHLTVCGLIFTTVHNLSSIECP